MKLDPFKDSENEFLLKYWLNRYDEHLQSCRERRGDYNPDCGLAILMEINRRKMALVTAKGWPNLTVRETRLVTEHYCAASVDNVLRSCYVEKVFRVMA